MALTKITSDIVESNIQQSGFKNKIIGGDFSTNPWQRGTSFPAIGNGAYSADRFLSVVAGAGVFSVLKTADAPTATQARLFTQHCLHVDVTTADASLASTVNYNIQQRIEGLNATSFGFGQAGTRYVTLSFWHKHTKTGVHCVSLTNSSTDRSYVAEYVQDDSDTWEYATITMAVDTTGTWLYDTGTGLAVRFALATGSNFKTTANTWAAGNFLATSNQVNNLDNTANNFKIALVQLEYGNQASMFENRSIGQELQLCQRYFQLSGVVCTSSNNNTNFGGNIMTEMRATPTATFTGVAPSVTVRSWYTSLGAGISTSITSLTAEL